MPRRKPKETPLSIGLTLIAMGLGMLLVPAMLRSSPMLDAFKAGLRTPGWVMLGLGTVAVALHLLDRAVQRVVAQRCALPGAVVHQRQPVL